MNQENIDALAMFGLTEKQTRILFSIERLMVLKDIRNSENEREKKQKWLKDWSACINDCFTSSNETINPFMTRDEILESIEQEDEKNINKTWYYLIMLEATLFTPYTALGKDKKIDKMFSKLKYKEQTQIIIRLVRASKIMDDLYIERFKKTYNKSITKLTDKGKTIAISILGVISIAAITAATAGAFSGRIAVAIFGTQFTGLSGAALTSACLAMAGGGAIAAGGAGVAGGATAIVGGGALLGLAGGGTVVGSVNLLAKSTPQLTLTQAAKLEVVLKEIIINAQKDIKCAQSILKNYKEQIIKLNSELKKMNLEQERDKKKIENLKKAISYMEKVFVSMVKFVSSYDIGSNIQD